MLFSVFDVLRVFEALQMFFYNFLLTWVKNERNFESSIFFEGPKYYFVFESRLNFFSNGQVGNVASTLTNVVKIDVENNNVVSTFSKVVQFNVEKHNVVSTFFFWRTQRCFNVDLTLCDVATSYQPKKTLNRRWNVWWDDMPAQLQQIL